MNDLKTMNNTLKEVAPDPILDKFKEAKILSILKKDTKNILFIGDRSILEYLEAHLQQKESQTFLNKIEFNKSNPEDCWRSIEHDKEDILQKTELVIIASINHERYIYEQVKQKFNQKILLLFDDIFINLVTGRNVFAPIPKNLTPPKVNYCILSTPRSGSTMFCDALTSTGLAGFPREHLREPSLTLEQHGNFDSSRYIKAIKSLHTTPNSVFGTKLISHFIKRYLVASNNQLNPVQYFDKFIYLVRQDKAAQAVSLFMAQKSGVWKINKAEKLSSYREKINNKSVTQEDLQQVHKLHGRLIQEEKFIEDLCQQNNIEPLVVSYEDLTTDLYSNVERVLHYLDIISSSSNLDLNIKIKEKKLSSQKSQEIVKLYKQSFC